MSDLTDRARALYNRVKQFPESDPSGNITLIELRNLVPELCDRIEQLEADAANWVDIPRLR